MRLWLLWVLATTLAFGIGGRFGAALSPSDDSIVMAYFTVSASLVLTGLLQWLVLRQLITDAGRWVLASAAAVVIVGGLVFGLGLINRDVGWVVGVVVGWIALGVLQWLVLREQVPGAGWWVLANMLGLIVAIPAVGFATWATGAPADGPIGGLIRWLAFGAAQGVVTGAALWSLLQERLQSATA